MLFDDFARLKSLFGFRNDAWYSSSTGAGTSDDKVVSYNYAETGRIPERTLEALYVEDSLAQRIIDAPVEDALRQSFKFSSESDPDAAERLQRSLEARYRFSEFVRQSLIEGRLYGGVGGVILADDDAEVSNPMRGRLVDNVNSIHLVRPSEARPMKYVIDPLDRRFGKPLNYNVQLVVPQAGAANLPNLHHTRLLRIEEGAKLTARERCLDNNGWPESVLKRVWEVLRSYRAALSSITTLFSDASQSVYKIKDLNRIINTGAQGKELLRARFDTVERLRSSMHAILLDSEGEDFERKATPMSEMANLLDRFMLQLAEAARMPVTRLFGMSPAGLNATGEGDMRMWYDYVQSYRELRAEPLMLKYISVMALDSRTPEVPSDLKIVWPSLYQLSPQELATTRLQVAQSDVAYINAGVFTPEDVALTRTQEDGWQLDIEIDEEQLELEQEIRDANQLAGNPSPAPQAQIGPRAEDRNAEPAGQPIRQEVTEDGTGGGQGV